jgi:hypothetical protein
MPTKKIFRKKRTSKPKDSRKPRKYSRKPKDSRKPRKYSRKTKKGGEEYDIENQLGKDKTPEEYEIDENDIENQYPKEYTNVKSVQGSMNYLPTIQQTKKSTQNSQETPEIDYKMAETIPVEIEKHSWFDPRRHVESRVKQQDYDTMMENYYATMANTPEEYGNKYGEYVEFKGGKKKGKKKTTSRKYRK